MVTNKELNVVAQEHEGRIAALEARMDNSELRHSKIEDMQERMGEAITMLREAVAKVATKDDIVELTKQVNDKFGQQLTQAHNSVPVKLSIAISAIMALIALLGLILPHVHA